MHTIRKTEPGVWTVGFMTTETWYSLEDFDNKPDAMAFCSWLNGGLSPELDERLCDGLKLGGPLNR